MTTSSISPLPGCGTFANQSTVAVSCTGIGEAFIKVVAAHQVSDRVRFSGENVEDAATATLDEVAAHHGDGGMIVLPAVGRGNETMFHWFEPVTYWYSCLACHTMM